MCAQKTRSSRIYILTSILIVVIGVTAVLLPSDPLIAARIYNMQHAHVDTDHVKFNPDDAAKMDIALGSVLPQVGAGKAIRAKLPHPAKGCFVVGLGNCAACIRFDFAVWEKQSKMLHVPLIGFSGALSQQIADFQRSAKVHSPIYFDEKNAFGQAINSYWNGRVYYFDSNWRLVWRMEGFGNPNDLNTELQLGLKELIGSHS